MNIFRSKTIDKYLIVFNNLQNGRDAFKILKKIGKKFIEKKFFKVNNINFAKLSSIKKE